MQAIAAQHVPQFRHLLRTTWIEFQRDNAKYFAAAMVFYASLSLVPLLVVLLAFSGLFLRFSEAPAEQPFLSGIEASFGPQARVVLEQVFHDLQQQSVVAMIISVGILLFSASIVFRHLRFVFRRVWHGTRRMPLSPGHTLRQTIADQVLAFSMVLMAGGLLLAAVVLGWLTRLLQLIFGWLPLLGSLLDVLLSVLSPLALGALTAAVLFRYLPPDRLAWREVWLAALLCAGGWMIASQLMTLYVFFFGARRSVYGALGSLLILLIWLYAMSLVFFFFAEFCKVYVHEHRMRNEE